MTTRTRRVGALFAFLPAAVVPDQHAWAQEHEAAGLYDARPHHIWNRLHAALYERSDSRGHWYGRDEIDPLLWISSSHLLTGPSHKAAIDVLDEFLSKAAEQQVHSPVARAILQRDLWAVFDWSAQRSDDHATARRELQVRIAQVMRRVALSPEEIRRLPDNYADAVKSRAFPARYDPAQRDTPFLPPDTFDPKGPWVCIGVAYGEPLAISHTAFAGGRSAFLVFMNLPGGREETLRYLRALRDHTRHWRWNTETGNGDAEVIAALDLPQFPPRTQFALARRLILVDNRGRLVPTTVTESLQIRVYRSIEDERHNGRSRTQDGFEFRLSREKLFQGEQGRLRAIGRDEKEFPLFQSHGFDVLELSAEEGPLEGHLRPALQFCGNCHQNTVKNAGIYSVLSYADSFFQGEYQRPVSLAEASMDDEAQFIVGWKQRQYNRGLLEGLWQSNPSDARRATNSSATRPAGGKAESAASPR